MRKKNLEQAEDDFDVHAASHRPAVGSGRGAHAPVFHRGDGLFFQAQSRAFQHARIDHAPVGGDDYTEQHASLILGFAGLVGIIGVRAVDASGLPDAIHARAKFAAAGPAAGTRSKTAAGTAANPAAIPCTNAAATARPGGIV